MNNTERYLVAVKVSSDRDTEWYVQDRKEGYTNVCVCWFAADAELICRALNEVAIAEANVNLWASMHKKAQS